MQLKECILRCRVVQTFSGQPASHDPCLGMTAQTELEQEAVEWSLGHLLCLQMCSPDTGCTGQGQGNKLGLGPVGEG